MENNNPKEIAELVAGSLEDFRKGMEAREQLSTRIGARTTQIIRFGMFGLSILGLALFYLIFILTKDFATITDEMGMMALVLEGEPDEIDRAVEYLKSKGVIIESIEEVEPRSPQGR